MNQPISVSTAPLSATIQVLLVMAIILGVGSLAWGLYNVDIYTALPRYRFRDLLWLSVGAGLASTAVILLLRLRPIIALGLSLLLLHIALVGLGPLLATVLLVFAGMAVGEAVVMRGQESSWMERILVGMGLIAGVVGWILPYTVHFQWVYFVCLALLVVWQGNAISIAARTAFYEVRAPFSGGWPLALALIVMVMALSASWLPVVISDDVAYHLALPSQLRADGYYHFNVQDQIWATAPWAGDVLHGIVMVLSGSETIAALNTVWILLAVALLWRISGRFGVDAAWRWLGIALFVSMPLLHALTNSMQTELASIAVFLALCDRVLDERGSHGRAQVLVVAILSAFLLALKFSNLAFIAPALIWWLVRHRPTRLSWLALGLVAGVVVAGSSYVYAAVLSGNPLLPLYNSVFKSSLMPLEDFSNTTFVGLLSWDALYQATFDTSRYVETLDGSFGFQWLAFGASILVALLVPSLRSLALVACAAIAILFLQMQYLRYLIPALALVAAIMTIMLSRSRFNAWIKAAVVAIVFLNVHFMCQASWHLRNGTITNYTRYGTAGYGEKVLEDVTPERKLLRALLARKDKYPVVLVGADNTAPVSAELAGRGLVLSWYATEYWWRSPALQQDLSGQLFLDFLDEYGVDHLLVRPELASPAYAAAIAKRGQLLDRQGPVALYKVMRPTLQLSNYQTDEKPLYGDGRHYRLPVDPLRPYIAEVSMRMRCPRKGWGVALNGFARGAFGERALGEHIAYCGADDMLVLIPIVQLPEGTKEWELRLQAYGPNDPVAMIEATALLRPDSPRERDLAPRLRLF